MIPILIFCLLIIILSINVHVVILGANTHIKMYLRIGMLRIVIPHQRQLSKVKLSNAKFIKGYNGYYKRFIFNIISHSKYSRVYFAKRQLIPIFNNPIASGLYLMASGILIGLLQNRTKGIEEKILMLKQDDLREKVDYYVDTQIDIITLIWVSIISIGGK